MATFKGLPVFELTFDDDFIPSMQLALVDLPAIAANFLKFKEERRKAYLVSNEEQHIIFGPAMIPDMPIYRIDENGEYYIQFSADTIAHIASAFAKGHNFNLGHDMAKPAKCTLLESYIINPDEGKYPSADFADLPVGTWMVKAHIDDDDQWEDVKAGKYNGFSIESFFNYHKLSQMKKNIFRRFARKVMCTSAIAVDAEGRELILEFVEEELADGINVYILDENGVMVAAPDGEYTIAEEKYTVKDGIITKVVEEIPAPEEIIEAPAPVVVEGEEEIVVEAPAPEEEIVEETPAPTVEERLAALEKEVAGIRDELKVITDSLAPVAEIHEEMKTLRSKQKELDKLASKLKEVHGEPVESTTLRAVEQKKDNPALKFFRK